LHTSSISSISSNLLPSLRCAPSTSRSSSWVLSLSPFPSHHPLSSSPVPATSTPPPPSLSPSSPRPPPPPAKSYALVRTRRRRTPRWSQKPGRSSTFQASVPARRYPLMLWRTRWPRLEGECVNGTAQAWTRETVFVAPFVYVVFVDAHPSVPLAAPSSASKPSPRSSPASSRRPSAPPPTSIPSASPPSSRARPFSSSSSRRGSRLSWK